jgi:Uma2 family endonuclease
LIAFEGWSDLIPDRKRYNESSKRFSHSRNRENQNMSTSATTTTSPTFTPDDLLTMPEPNQFELIDGELVEIQVSALTSWIAAELLSRIRNQCDPSRLAWVFGADCGYQCFPDHPNRVRKPDVSVVLRSRLRADQLEVGFLTIPPDLAVEVLSPNDLAYDIERKVVDYLNAGVRLIWIVIPPTRTVRIQRLDGTAQHLKADDHLTGEDLLPGFSCKVGELFPEISSANPSDQAGPVTTP